MTSVHPDSTLLPHVFYGMGKRSGDDGWGYLEQSPSTACLADPPVNIFDQSNFPHWVSTPFLPYYFYRYKCTGTTAHTGRATPASRCEPTFRSSETPALIVPKQRPCVCQADFGQGPGPRSKCPHTCRTINHQSPFSKRVGTEADLTGTDREGQVKGAQCTERRARAEGGRMGVWWRGC